MSDNFFGFNSDFPAGLGVLGRPVHDDDELLADEVEEEYDALNDETFGRAANDDWEEAHEKLTELIKNNNIDVKSYFNDSLLENDDSPEEIVSKSISQLGLEDDLDDPAIMTISRNCHSSSRLRTAFSSSPPPPAILESEICGSPKTHSIWSTTPKDSGISFLKSFGHSSSSHHSESHNFSLNSGPDSVFISPQKAWRAEELEKDLIASSKPEKTSNSWPEASSPVSSNQNVANKFPQAQRHPNLNHNHNLNQRVFTREEVERQLIADSRISYNKVGNLAQRMPSPLAHPNMPPIRPGNLNVAMQPPPNLPFRHAGAIIGAPDRPFMPFRNNLHPRSMMNHFPPRADFLLPNHPMAGVLSPYVGMPIRPINHPLMPKWEPPVYLDKHHEQNFRNGPVQNEEDEYAGLMTQKEKEWLIRIQLLLLKCENPYVEDYYYTTMVTRKCKKKYSENAKKGSGDAPELILPETPKPEKTSYVPTQFEGSLGKLQAVSVNFPRKVLDIKVTRTLEDDEGRVVTNQSLQKYRRLLLDIEKLYTCFLEIEDEERRILALPDTDEAPHRKNIVSLTQRIFNGLCTEHSPEENFQNIMIVRKGKTLFLRAFPLFSQEQQLQCLIYLCQCLTSILRKDQTDSVLLKNHRIVTDVIQKLSLPDLLQMAEGLENGGTSENSKEKNNFIAALKNKFGSSVICTMVERAEYIYSGSELLETNIHSKWSNIMTVLADFLCNIGDTSLCPPFTPPSLLINHFNRFILDQDKLEILTSKLKVFEGSPNGKEVEV